MTLGRISEVRLDALTIDPNPNPKLKVCKVYMCANPTPQITVTSQYSCID